MRGKRIVTLVTAISLVGCTTMRTMEAEKETLAEKIEVGDHLVVYESSGRIVDMTLTEFDGSNLHGKLTADSFIGVDVNIDDVEKLEIEKVDGVKTTFAVIGGAVVILPLLIVAAMTGAMFSGQ